MDDLALLETSHPVGEMSNDDINSFKNQDISCDTFAGIVHVESDEQAPVTPMG